MTIAARAGIVWPIRSDSATLTGGSYESTLPLTNAQTATVADVARTTTDAIASATINVDMGAAVEIAVVALSRHNVQKDGLWRIRGGSDVTFATNSYDSGWIAAWPVQWASGVLPSGHPNYATRLLTNAQIAALNPARDLVHVMGAATSARYWRIEIDDTTNTDTFIAFGRLVMGPMYQPSSNMNVGATMGFDDGTIVARTLSGAKYFDARPRGRTITATFGPVSNAEAVGVLREIHEQTGVDGQFYWLTDPSDAANLQRTSFLAQARQLSAVEYAAAGFGTYPFACDEVL